MWFKPVVRKHPPAHSHDPQTALIAGTKKTGREVTMIKELPAPHSIALFN
jgi:hypothetical protein